MNRKKRGFSLAELLISLLVISLVLSAAIPAITKRAGQQRELIWRWSDENNAAFTATGANQSVLIGTDAQLNMAAASLFPETSASSTTEAFSGEAKDRDNLGDGSEHSSVSLTNPSGTTIVNASDYGDKLTLVKRRVNSTASNFFNSHITFYTQGDAANANPEYAGRIAMDNSNVAMGIGTLQSLLKQSGTTVRAGENTALGHYALFHDTKGFRNTAVGKRTLSYNTEGSYNTALGYGSLFRLGISNNACQDGAANAPAPNNITAGTSYCKYENTAVGAEAMHNLQYGHSNTALGSRAMANASAGDRNTAIGFHSLGNENLNNALKIENTAVGADALLGLKKNGSYNTAIGAKACQNLQEGDNNICIGYYAGNGIDGTHSNELFIGGYDTYPLISGHTKAYESTYPKDLIVSAKHIEINKEDHSGVKLYLKSDGSSGYITAASSYTYSSSSPTYNTYKAVKLNEGQLTITPAADNTTSSDMNITTADSQWLKLNTYLQVKNESNTPTVTMDAANGFKVNAAAKPINLASSTGAINITTSGTGAITIKSTSSGVITIGNNTSSTISIGGKSIGGTLTNYNGSNQNIVTAINNLISGKQNVSTSDARLKNIKGDSKAGLKEINQLQVKDFTFKNDEKKTPRIGVIAQQLMKVFPNAVYKTQDGYYAIRTDDILFAVVNSVKELCAQIQDLTAKITGLDARLKALEEENKLLKEKNAAFEKRFEALEKRQAALEKK